MTVRVAINGFGRIGRSFLRASLGSGADLQIVAVNDLAEPGMLAHMLRYDTVLGPFGEPVTFGPGRLTVGEQEIRTFNAPDPAVLPWQELEIDVVVESTGMFTAGGKARAHLDAGARKVVISVRPRART
jgi:glyceraldehyde 3-phosphate dehydrogenase